MYNVTYHMSNVENQILNVNKVKLLSERTSGVPPVIFSFTVDTTFVMQNQCIFCWNSAMQPKQREVIFHISLVIKENVVAYYWFSESVVGYYWIGEVGKIAGEIAIRENCHCQTCVAFFINSNLCTRVIVRFRLDKVQSYFFTATNFHS